MIDVHLVRCVVYRELTLDQARLEIFLVVVLVITAFPGDARVIDVRRWRKDDALPAS
jgi:hypothetical protein